MRRPLSSVPEEAIFARMDDACDRCAAGLKPFILARFKAHAAAMNRTTLALAVAHAAPTAVRMAFDATASALAFTGALFPQTLAVAKARKPKVGTSEAEVIDAAVDEGLQIGLETLPAKIRDRVDLEAARALTRRRLIQGTFRQTLAAYNESLNGLGTIAGALRHPGMAFVRDVERLASTFGLNARQAKSIVREAQALYDYVPEKQNTKKRLDALWRSFRARVKQALEARAETLAQTLGQEIISTATQALYETALKDDLLDIEADLVEWVTRHDERVCERCDGFDGKRAKIDEMFVSDSGEEAYQPGIHPRCRCRTRLVHVRSAVRQSRRRAA